MSDSRGAYAGIFLISAAALALEVTLTRLFSIMLWYHYAFMIVSLAMLGYALSGVALAWLPEFKTEDVLTASAALMTIICILGYLAANHLSFDPHQVSWNPLQALILLTYILAFTVPFMFSGLCVAVGLKNVSGGVAGVYASSFLGSGFGSLAAVYLLSVTDVSGVVAAVALTAAVAATAFSVETRWFKHALAFTLLASLLLLSNPLPDARISPYKPLMQALRHPESSLFSTTWNPLSRVDVVYSPVVRHAPGLSLTYPGVTPTNPLLYTDGGGEDVIPLLDDTGYLEYLPSSLPFRFREKPRVLVLGYSGLDILSALYYNASVTVVEPNPMVTKEAAAHTPLLDSVTVVHQQPRSFMKRSRETYDVIILPLSGGTQSSTGIQNLNENYMHTVEAYRSYLAHLEDGGVFIVSTWLRNPPRENLRVVSLASQLGEENSVAVYRTLTTHTLLVRKNGFTPTELQTIKDFCSEMRYDIVYLPQGQYEVNKYNVFPEPLYHRLTARLMEDQEVFYREYLFDVSPVHDGNPYFNSYFRWSSAGEIYRSLRGRWEAFLEGGFTVNLVFIILLTLSVVIVASAAAKTKPSFNVLAYFTLIGVAYMFNEVVFIQRFILFLGHPVYSVALVVSVILVSSGLGSLASRRLKSNDLKRVLPALSLITLAYILVLPAAFDLLLPHALPYRILSSIVLLTPMGFLMGMPFPMALESVRESTPLAWAVNGCASVLASVAVILLSLSCGFDTVQAAAAAAYLLALFFRPNG